MSVVTPRIAATHTHTREMSKDDGSTASKQASDGQSANGTYTIDHTRRLQLKYHVCWNPSTCPACMRLSSSPSNVPIAVGHWRELLQLLSIAIGAWDDWDRLVLVAKAIRAQKRQPTEEEWLYLMVYAENVLQFLPFDSKEPANYWEDTRFELCLGVLRAKSVAQRAKILRGLSVFVPTGKPFSRTVRTVPAPPTQI